MKGGELGRNYEDEEVVFREGEQGAAIYVIQSGGVRITKETVDVEVTCRLILEEVKNLTQAENGSIMLFDDEGKRLVLTAAYGSEAESKTPLRRGEGIAGEVAKTGEALLVPDTSQDPRFLSGEFRVQSLACAPLIFEGTIFGVINMSNSSGRELTTREFEILQSLGLFASLAIHNATHFSRVHRAAEEVFRKAILLDY